MFIKTVHLENFKRFTDLTLDLSRLDPPPKLVLMIGVNGSGKTSIFDAFNLLSSVHAKNGKSLGSGENFTNYYRKFDADHFQTRVEFTDGSYAQQEDGIFTADSNRTDAFYGRSALRQVPRLQRTSRASAVDTVVDQDRPQRYIDRDERFENDIVDVAINIFEEIYADDFDSRKLREQFIDPLNDSLKRIFGADDATSLALERLIPSLQNDVADIRFRKGNSTIHYDLLSSGEKEVFNILLNLFNRSEHYTDTIYFIDELDVHLNTTLQYALLKEIVENWIPDGCQLWTASHSLGFIQYAQEAEHAAILDFDQYDFDQPRTIVPEPKYSTEVYEIAVPQEALPVLFKDLQIFFCEGKDVELYNGLKLEGKIFIKAHNKGEVYRRAKHNLGFYGLMDRDYLSPEEVQNIRVQLPNLFVLDLYSIESYLYHPQNLQEVDSDFDVDWYIEKLLEQKRLIRDVLLLGYEQARGGYQVLREEPEIKVDAKEYILSAIQSDIFDDYYPLLTMKSKKKFSVDRSFLEKNNFRPSRLAETNWFREQIRKLLEE